MRYDCGNGIYAAAGAAACAAFRIAADFATDRAARYYSGALTAWRWMVLAVLVLVLLAVMMVVAVVVLVILFPFSYSKPMVKVL